MRRVLSFAVLAVWFTVPAAAQEPLLDETTVLDSIAVEGMQRVTRATILTLAGVPLGEPVSFRDVQRAIDALYASGQFADIQVWQGAVEGRQILRFTVRERPLLVNWTVRGADKVSERKVRGKVTLLAGRPYDPAAAARSRSAIDSLYQQRGYYLTNVVVRELPQTDGALRVAFEIDEGRRVVVSRVEFEGNEQFPDGRLAGKIKTKPEGFWWFRKGEYNEDKLERDVRERLPVFYASQGFIDFQVLDDTLIVNPETRKATLRIRLDEGERYQVGSFEIVGNRFFSTEDLERFYPFRTREASGFLGLGGGSGDGPALFDQARWAEATQQVHTLYMNAGYIYAQVSPAVNRRTEPDGTNVVDLRWQIVERNPAIVNKVMVRGNTTTHESVIRRAIFVVPGDVLRQSALIQSYQSIANIGFFEQPMPPPSTEPANQQGDVNVTFHVTERHTGNINFGASVGQGTGVGGFIGLTEPNLLGRGKTVALQWQFGRNINDFNISYTDPAIRGSLISGTVSLHSSRLRFTVADLGRIDSRGGSVQIGFPVAGSRFTRFLTSYTLEQQKFQSATLAPSGFTCNNCVLSQIGVSLVRDTRIDLPFPSGGMMHRIDLSQGGGPLSGSGNFRRMTLEGRWYAPLAVLGGVEPGSNPMKVVLGFSSKAGFVWGDPGPHFRQLFSMGGTQFGIPLRGYDEFSITPQGFDPRAQGFRAGSVNAFGRAYFAMTGEIGLRLNQSMYLNTFLDAGNVWVTPAEFNPTQLFRGAGIGASLVTPLGPIGLDYAYGFDRVNANGDPTPSWKFHFKLGNFF